MKNMLKLKLNIDRCFRDPEYGCTFTPAFKEASLEIAKGTKDASFVSIILFYSPGQTPNPQLKFNISFFTDATKHHRFTSAVFHAEFRVQDKNGGSKTLKLCDVQPQSEEYDHSETDLKKHRGWKGGVKIGGLEYLGLDVTYTNAETQEGKRSTSSYIIGHGQHTHSADWTFREDIGLSGRGGLKSSYELSVELPSLAVRRTVCMEFWCKADIARRHSSKTVTSLYIGGENNRYKRNIDLSVEDVLGGFLNQMDPDAETSTLCSTNDEASPQSRNKLDSGKDQGGDEDSDDKGEDEEDGKDEDEEDEQSGTEVDGDGDNTSLVADMVEDLVDDIVEEFDG